MSGTAVDSLSGRVLEWGLKLLGILFLVLGALKLHGLLLEGNSYKEEYLTFSNPIFGFATNRLVIGATACFEIFIGWQVVIKSRLQDRRLLASSLLLWFSSMAILYKIGLIYVHYTGPCGCLFGINSLIPISAHHQSTISDYIIVATFIFSVLSSAWLLLKGKELGTASELAGLPNNR